MWLTIARFELRSRLRLVSTWIYVLLFAGLAFLSMIASAGAFESVSVAFGSGGKVNANAPFALLTLQASLDVMVVLVTAAIAGQSVHQDIASGMHPLVYALPIRERAYLLGRFAAALAVTLIVAAAIPLGLELGAAMPFVDHARIQATPAWQCWQPFLLVGAPNAFAFAALFFALAALGRRISPVHVGSVLLLVGYITAGSMAGDLDEKPTAAVIDPFGVTAIGQATEHWTIAEKNQRALPLAGLVLANRALWCGVGLVALGLTLARFRFRHLGVADRARGAADAPPPEGPMPSARARPRGALAELGLLPRLAWLELRQIVASRALLVISLAAIAMLVNAGRMVGKMYGTTTWPVTYEMLDVVGGMFPLFALILLTIYAGEAVWREREAGMDQIADALPVRGWTPYAAKLAALVGLQALLLAALAITCVAIQAAKGWFGFEPGQYARTLALIQLPHLALIAVVAVAAQAIAPTKHVAHLLMIVFFLYGAFLSAFGFEHRLWVYASSPGVEYSDMNGYGGAASGIAWFDAWWAGWAMLIAIGTRLLWPRGAERGWRARLRAARRRWSRPIATAAVCALVAIVACGAVILVNTTRLNRYRTGWQQEVASERYERAYKPWQGRPQPRIATVNLTVDLYPERRAFDVAGTYRLRNKTDRPIDAVLVRLPWKARIDQLAIDGASERAHDDELGLHEIALASPLPPGGEATLSFGIGYAWSGFANRVLLPPIEPNGTFISSEWLPQLGYDPDAELSDENLRRKHRLPEKERMADVDDLAARANTYVSRDADWIDFAAAVSTSPDQIALAPGDCVGETMRDGRRVFAYRAHRILNFYSFLSARYAVAEAEADGVALRVYHDPRHAFDVPRMLRGLEASLAYCRAAFAPYPYRQIRIAEFPRYQSFAQSFPSTIPFSEGIGFIARVDESDPKGFDYPFYVTAHEVAHQWWAHQAIGADVRGCAMLSETLAQYTAMMVCKRAYGEAKMGRFLRHELDQYLMGRSFERRRERPLARVEQQGYIHYNKGSVAMYLLQDLVGQDRIDGALRDWLHEVAWQEPPYTTSEELIRHLRAATPPELAYLIDDLFETITLYDDRAVSATCAPKDGRWEVTLTLAAKKLRATELGDEREVPMDDVLPIGAVDGDGTLIAMEKRRVASGESTVTFTVDREPAKVGVDPLCETLDREPNDNLIAPTMAR